MRPVPGDQSLEPPFWYVDHVVNINSKPESIWPWLAQMGNSRAGWYSYDWIDNFGKPSFRHIEPRLQGLQRGQKISVFRVEDFELNRFLTLKLSDGCNMTWQLEPIGEYTNLITRLRVRGPKILCSLLVGPAHGFMQRKQNREIKERVEAARS